ncbi:hypothetical protein ECEC1736_4613, partial [Escherichia coli EC1736]
VIPRHSCSTTVASARV